jgi:hypothetical protein
MTLLLLMALSLGDAALAAPTAPTPPPVPAAPTAADWSAKAHQREDELLALVKTRSPERYTELAALRTSDPAAYFMALEKIARMVEAGDDPEARARLEEMQALEVQIDVLAQAYPLQSADQQAKTRAEMERIAGHLFDLKQETRRMRLEQMSARLDELKDEISDRDAHRAEIIDDYVGRRVDGEPEL